MKKSFKKLILRVLVALLVFVSTATATYAVPQTITLGGTETLEGYVSGVKFTTKTTKDGGYLYCLDM